MCTQTYLEQLSFSTIGCMLEVHRNLGPGLLESVYHSCLLEEFRLQGIQAADKPYVPIFYKNQFLGGKLQMDILVEDALVIELKAVELMIPLYKAQLLTYLKLSGKHKGILVNFNSELIKDQMHSLVRPSFYDLPKL
jgi:GxxExxY protein